MNFNPQEITTGRALPRFSLTPDEAAESTGFSRTRIFQAIRDEELTAVKNGKATVIEIAELLRWLRSLPTRGRRPSSSAQAEGAALWRSIKSSNELTFVKLRLPSDKRYGWHSRSMGRAQAWRCSTETETDESLINKSIPKKRNEYSVWEIAVACELNWKSSKKNCQARRIGLAKRNFHDGNYTAEAENQQ
jgi:excisionase family DNA binding protein